LECLGVEGLSWAEVEAVVDELSVSCGGVAFEYEVAAVAWVVEEWVSDVFHVCADLVCASGFEGAFGEGGVGEAFEDAVVCDGGFAFVAVGEDGHLLAVAGVSADMSFDASFVGQVSPNEGLVGAGGAFAIELFAESGFGGGVFGDDEQAGGVFVEAMD